MALLKKIFSIFSDKNASARKKKPDASSQVRFIEEENNEIEKTLHIDVKPPQQHYIIKSGGEYAVYNSKEEIPPELREELEKLESAEGVESLYTVIIDGKRQTFSRMEDIPEDIRKLLSNGI